MKTVLLPVYSNYCKLILNGEKTIEVRSNDRRSRGVMWRCEK